MQKNRFIYLTFLICLLSSKTSAQEEYSFLELKRNDKIIRITRQGLNDESGIFAICQPTDDHPHSLAIFNEATEKGVLIETDDIKIHSKLALVTQKDGDGDIKAGGGVAKYTDGDTNSKEQLDRCGVKVDLVADEINIEQGKSNIKGSFLTYSKENGLMEIKGPIQFQRENLSGDSEKLEFNIDTKETLLIGKVNFNLDNRKSFADKVIYNDKNATAILIGEKSNAYSFNDKEKIEAPLIIYYLDTNEVILESNKEFRIKGSFIEN